MTRAHKCSIVMYHYVRDLPYTRYPKIKGLLTSQFKEQLAYIERHYQFVTVNDCLNAIYSNGSKLGLESCLKDVSDFPMKVKTIKGEWIVNDLVEGFAKGPSGLCLPIIQEHLSYFSTNIVKSILETGLCDLPKMDDSVHIHRIFLMAMLKHWNKNSNRNDNYVPIT